MDIHFESTPPFPRAYPIHTESYPVPPEYTSSHRGVLVDKTHIPWPQGVAPHKLLVPRWSLILGVACQHALDAHADALNVLDGGPALRAEEVEADVAVGIHVRVHGDGAGWGCEVRKGYFGGFCIMYLLLLVEMAHEVCRSEGGCRGLHEEGPRWE